VIIVVQAFGDAVALDAVAALSYYPLLPLYAVDDR
jgi:hypothetical protein